MKVRDYTIHLNHDHAIAQALVVYRSSHPACEAPLDGISSRFTDVLGANDEAFFRFLGLQPQQLLLLLKGK